MLLLAFSNDFRDNNELLEKADLTPNVAELLEQFENDNGRKLIRRVIDLAQRTSMLHEKINYLRVHKKLETLGEDWKARKEYVDFLYKGLEKRNKVKASYIANYTIKEEDFHWNIAFLDGKQYAGKVDLFVGGSPCRSFSFVGKQRGLDDTRGTLFYEYARLIDEIRPKVFIYENVRAVTSHDGGKTWEKMQQVFSELDYNFSWKVLNARDYSHHEDISKAKYFRFYKNEINDTRTYEIEPVEGVIQSRELVSRKQLDEILNESGCDDGKERFADFYYILKVEVKRCNCSRISCNIADLNNVNGNDTFSPHSPKVVTEGWLLRQA